MSTNVTFLPLSEGGTRKGSPQFPDLMTDGRGDPHPTEANLLIALKTDTNLRGLMRFNEFSLDPEITRAPPSCGAAVPPASGPYPRLLLKPDIIRIAAYVQAVYCHKFKIQTVQNALLVEAADNPVHPVRSYFDTVAWDGTPRIHTWLTQVFGVEMTPYSHAVGSKTLQATVRRVRQPGCKFDHVLVLESNRQGIGKSSAIKMLFGPDWYTDQHGDIRTKEFSIGLKSKLVLEFAEIDRIMKYDSSDIKSVMTRATDYYRPPYEASARDVPRQCIFIGTTNRDDYLTDPTGNRRYWPVTCRSAEAGDLDWLQASRDQLWAEAVVTEPEARLWLDDPSVLQQAESAQKDRVSEDSLLPQVSIILEDYRDITVGEILGKLGFNAKDIKKSDEMRVAGMLRELGWTKSKRHSPRHRQTLSIWDQPEGGKD